MTTKNRLALSALGCLLLGGCACGPGKYQTTMGTGIQPEDRRRADEYRQTLPTDLWLSSKQTHVEPGVGVTYLIVSGVDTEPMRRLVESNVAEFNAHHPFHQVQLTFQ